MGKRKVTLAEIVENAGYETRSYSGRCMYGKDCLGIDTPQMLPCIADLVQAAADMDSGEDPGAEGSACWILQNALRNARTDNMGLGMILYFPEVAWEGTEEEEEEDDPDSYKVGTLPLSHGD
jgi:hypothetical protein